MQSRKGLCLNYQGGNNIPLTVPGIVHTFDRFVEMIDYLGKALFVEGELPQTEFHFGHKAPGVELSGERHAQIQIMARMPKILKEAIGCTQMGKNVRLLHQLLNGIDPLERLHEISNSLRDILSVRIGRQI